MGNGSVNPSGGVPNPLFRGNEGTSPSFAVDEVKPSAWPVIGTLTKNSVNKVCAAVEEDMMHWISQDEADWPRIADAVVRSAMERVAAKKGVTPTRAKTLPPPSRRHRMEKAMQGTGFPGATRIPPREHATARNENTDAPGAQRSRRSFAVDGVKNLWASPFTGKLTRGSQKAVWAAVKEDVERCFKPEDMKPEDMTPEERENCQNRQAQILDAILRRAKGIVAANKSAEAKKSAEAEKGVTRRKNHGVSPGKSNPTETEAERKLEIAAIRGGQFRVAYLLERIKTKNDFDAVKTVLTDRSERREAAIDAACRELALMVRLEDPQKFTADPQKIREDARKFEVSLDAMKRGLKLAFPHLSSVEVEKKVDEVKKKADAANYRPWRPNPPVKLTYQHVMAFSELLERDWILENVASLFYRKHADGNPLHVNGNPLVVKPLIIERVFEAFSAKTGTEYKSENAGNLKKNEREALFELLEDARKKVPETLPGLIAATAGQPNDVRLTRLYGADVLETVLLRELEGLNPEASQKELLGLLSDKVSPPNGKVWITLTVGDLRQVLEDFEELKEALVPPLPSPDDHPRMPSF